MPIQRTHRVPVVLLSLLAATLLFPGALEETRIAVGAWLPATVRAERTAPVRLAEEERAWYATRIAQLEDRIAARPGGDTALGGARIADRPLRATPELLPARVLHRESSPLRQTFVIDAGRDDGVVPGQPVVQQDSLIGVVVTASARAARVLRIDDRSAATSFPAMVLAADAKEGAPCRGLGVARGTGDGVRVSFLPQDGARAGDLVVTGAGSWTVPEGLVIGIVECCEDDDRDGAFDAEVRPLRDLDAVSSVHVIRTEAPGLRVDAK